MKRVVGIVCLFLALGGFIALLGMDSAGAQEKGAKGGAVFELYKDKGGSIRFRLKDAAGNLLAVASKGYKTKTEAEAIIQTVQREAAKATVVDSVK